MVVTSSSTNLRRRPCGEEEAQPCVFRVGKRRGLWEMRCVGVACAAGRRRRAMLRAMPDELLALTCPRCEAAVDQRYYGPCASCRESLRATQGGEAHALE